ncbi:NAD(P)/FAD-dependent oxidoreductase [Robbsia andropogonis]|uniref:NAD(P)/FAD-dependent oxidoreductase n=1 Tax=Robbsia andropogonis TaxID=28092 RepID=UPI003D1BBD20
MSVKSIVVAGAGHAARRAAEALRERDAEVRITLVGAEEALPYDRPVLSKEALTSADGARRAFIRDAAWYDAQRITLQLGTRVTAIDRSRRVVTTDRGGALPYDALLLATGSRVRPFPGPVDTDVPLHYVRTVADAQALRAVLQPGTRVAVLGGGFIGLEVAASARALGCTVTLFEAAPRLLQRSMPSTVGAYLLALHRGRGVDVRLGARMTALRRSDEGAIAVDAGADSITADVVVVGIGVLPNVELAAAAGLRVDNGIVVDAQCRTEDPHISAAGEVTSHFNPLLGRHLRVESWQVAENQPVVAAANMLGADDRYAEIPWLWSDQYTCNVQTLGIFASPDMADASERLVLRGDPANDVFSLFSLDGGQRLQAAVTVNAGRDMAVCRRLLTAGKSLDPAALQDGAVTLRSLL